MRQCFASPQSLLCRDVTRSTSTVMRQCFWAIARSIRLLLFFGAAKLRYSVCAAGGRLRDPDHGNGCGVIGALRLFLLLRRLGQCRVDLLQFVVAASHGRSQWREPAAWRASDQLITRFTRSPVDAQLGGERDDCEAGLQPARWDR
jgi:hypothetical protein